MRRGAPRNATERAGKHAGASKRQRFILHLNQFTHSLFATCTCSISRTNMRFRWQKQRLHNFQTPMGDIEETTVMFHTVYGDVQPVTVTFFVKKQKKPVLRGTLSAGFLSFCSRAP